MKPRLAITLGDPAGIGPEIVAKALRDKRVRAACEPVVLGNPSGFSFPIGRPSAAAGQCAIEALEQAIQLLKNKQVAALVTAPVSKESFHAASLGFPGHTEWLAQAVGVEKVAMLMVAGSLRALLMTRHVPLRDVAQHLTPGVIKDSAEMAYEFVRKVLKQTKPRLVACGINPHAGDQGLIGDEEKRTLVPTLQALKKRGIPVAGPFSADAVYPAMAKGRYDLALAAYHDQGMIPLKLFAGEKLVNITLGLPFVRTSPGHGTAYDIAGKKKADAGPMMEAILLAARYAK